VDWARREADGGTPLTTSGSEALFADRSMSWNAEVPLRERCGAVTERRARAPHTRQSVSRGTSAIE
jgi:hypothetical protein